MSEVNPTPNSVKSAAELFQRFWIGDIMTEGANPDDDDRAAVIAAQLLAIATQLERVADTQERIAKVLETSDWFTAALLEIGDNIRLLRPEARP